MQDLIPKKEVEEMMKDEMKSAMRSAVWQKIREKKKGEIEEYADKKVDEIMKGNQKEMRNGVRTTKGGTTYTMS